MKKYIITTLILATVLATSCKKLVDVDPINSQPGSEALKSGQNVKGVLASAYSRLLSNQFLGGEVIRTNELYGDNINFVNATGGAPAQFVTRDFSLFNQQGRDLWGNGYAAIGLSNIVIDAVDRNLFNDMTTLEKAQMKAEAQFIRGVAHFELVRLFAKPYSSNPNSDLGIPISTKALTTNEAKSFAPRNTVSEVYNQAINDLKAAENVLQNRNSVFATKWAAKAYLARIYFSMNDYTNAFTYANDVIANGGYTLGTSVTAPFRTPGGILASALPDGVIFTAIGDGSLLRGNFWSTDPNNTYLPLAGTFYTDIQNKGGNRFTQLTQNANRPISTKWSGDNAVNVPVLRLAEMYLVRAESRVLRGAAYTDADVRADYNAVRAVANVTADNATSGSTALLAAIRTERRIEFAMEGDQFNELRRLKLNVRGVAYNDSKQLLKIPDSETNANPAIVQN
ncbi:RagB/SusD family nutrient uptake outer membrane protein [Pelobium sp.]|nr:RagB/SusD family nutrient uptake outer membrane protein [Pelobium sp.]MDA9555420.1 RagB/SusD family nutrient uptake outer membrane protein [Pelobium sp.]